MRMDRYHEIWSGIALAASRIAEDAREQGPYAEVTLNDAEQLLVIEIHSVVWKLIVELGMEVKRLY
jgi:hypothetical protein